jgi:hypothetical protein
MHTCALMALPAKGDDCRFSWSVKAASAGRIEVTEIGSGRRVADPWKKLCLERVRRAAGGDPAATEFVICPTGEELVARRDVNAFGAVLSILQQSSWGARLFVALSTRLLASDLVESRATVESWLETARQARIADLFHVDYDPGKPESISPLRLWDAIGGTEPRRQLLASLFPSSRPWLAVLPPKPTALSALIGRAPERTLAGSDLVLVVDEADPEFQCNYVGKKIERFREHQLIVATLSAPPSQELVFLCQKRRLAPPISMKGELELWFFLLRLNSTRESLPAPTRSIAPVQRPALKRVFLPDASSPKVLFTSAFDAHDTINCEAAAKDLGRIFSRVPVDVSYNVEPFITLGRLVEVLNEHGDLNIWIHSGHGAPYQGLSEAGSDASTSVRRWLRCFGSQKLRLELAVFLTCYSAQVARHFARAGARVAVGFEGEVDTNNARLVAAGLLTGVVQGGLRRDVILDCLVGGFERFKGIDWSRCKPKAYYLPRR